MTPKQAHYLVHLHKTEVTFKLSFRGGTFFRIERVSGKLADSHVKHLGLLIPLKEADIAKHYAKLAGATIEVVGEKKSQFNKFNSAWFAFYNKFAGFPPKFGGADANHLKQIIAYLTQLEGTEEKALILWTAILQNWHTLGEFHRKNTDLKYINSQLNKILNELKNNSTDPTGTFNDALKSDAGRNFKFS